MDYTPIPDVLENDAAVLPLVFLHVVVMEEKISASCR
jgi:hypothetical protein